MTLKNSFLEVVIEIFWKKSSRLILWCPCRLLTRQFFYLYIMLFVFTSIVSMVGKEIANLSADYIS